MTAPLVSAFPLAIALPLLGGAGVLQLRHRSNAREAASLLAGTAVAAWVLTLWSAAGEGLQVELWSWLPGLSIAFELEPIGLVFATVAAVLWPVTTVYAIGYLRANDLPRQTSFYVFFAVAIAASLWIAFSANLLTLFVGYEALTLATVPLVSHGGDAEARRGGRVYAGILLATSLCFLLPAIVWTWVLAGSTDFVPGGLLAGESGPALAVLFALFLFGTGKAALMPFHRWLPAAMVAPTPVSALLHAVAVVKAGVFVVLKVVVYVFGLDTLTEGTASVMMWVAAVTLVVAGLVAITKDNLKARLAYSTVSQLAYIVLAATLANETATTGGTLHLMTHAVGKITLFFCAGAIYTATRRTKVTELDGLGRAMPWTFGAFTVASLSVVGLPPGGGTWSKWLLLKGAVDAEEYVMFVVLLLGSLLALAYLMPVAVRGFLRSPPAGAVGRREAPAACVVPLVVTAAASVALFLVPDVVIGPVADLWR